MARKPPGVDPATWRAQRDRLWWRRNRVLDALMLVAIALILIRYCGSA